MLAISTTNLCKQFGPRTVVDQLNLAVPLGSIYGFLGPNGAGKSTTIGMLLGLIRPSRGAITILGSDLLHNGAQVLKQVGAMIEAPAFYPYLNGRDNLRVLAKADQVADSQVEHVLKLVELSDHARQNFRSYSQGMKQRLAIAATLLHEPQLIILDEPTNGLDPAGQHEIRDLVRSLAHAGRTIFFSSHQLSEVEQLCDRVAILKQGRVVAEGPVAQLLHRGEGLLVSVSGDIHHAIAVIRQLPNVQSVSHHEQQLQIMVPHHQAAAINAALISAGIAVSEIRARNDSLEDLFLELTK